MRMLFEPTKDTFNVLNYRFSESTNVKCINKACWTTNTIKLYHPN